MSKRNSVFDASLNEIANFLKISNRREITYQIDKHQDQDWLSEHEKSVNTPKLILDDPNHKIPQSRRDFLASGIIKSSISLALPGLGPSLARASCQGGAGGGGGLAANLPIIQFDASGGASLTGDNFMVGEDNDPYKFFSGLDDYISYGVPAAQHPINRPPVTPFGGGTMPMHAESFVYKGIMDSTSATTRANTDGTIVAVASDDDTQNNKFNISHALAKAGVRGNLANVIGSGGNDFGGSSSGILRDASFVSTSISGESSAQQISSPGLLESSLSNIDQIKRVVAGIAELSEAQVNAIKMGAATTDEKNAVICGAKANQTILGSPGINIYNDPTVQQAFNNLVFDENSRDQRTVRAVAACALLAIQGKVGPSTIRIGGFDYHGADRTGQDPLDYELGLAIGRTLEIAALNSTPVMIYVLSDGSCAGDRRRPAGGNSVMYRQGGDGGSKGVAVMIAYNPVAKPTVIKKQLGNYSLAGVVPNATAWSQDPEAAALVVLANYMFLNGKLADFGKLAPNPPFNVNDVIAFAEPIKT